MNISTLESEILKLPAHARASMIDLLHESLALDAERDLDKKWGEEAERRSAAYDRGELESVDAHAAIADLRQKLAR